MFANIEAARVAISKSMAARVAKTVRQLALFHQPVVSHSPVDGLYHP